MKLKPFEDNEQFSSDGNTIFYQSYGMNFPKPIPEVDVDSFETKSNVLACDKNKVYAISTMGEGLQIFEPVDRDSVVFITSRYFADRYNLYYYNEHFVEFCHLNSDSKIKQALQKNNPDTNAWWNYNDKLYKNLKLFKYNIYTTEDKFFYHFKENQLGYDEPTFSYKISRCKDSLGDCFLELPKVEKETFEVLNNVYSKDSKQVYFYSRPISADTQTFKILDSLFAKDKNGIWYNGRLAKIKHLESFEIITNDIESREFHFCKDQFNVYSNITSKIRFGGYTSLLTELNNSDPNTFQEISDVWSKDGDNVYWLGKIYKKADAETFEKISERPFTEFDYARDKNHVYIANGITLKKGLERSNPGFRPALPSRRARRRVPVRAAPYSVRSAEAVFRSRRILEWKPSGSPHFRRHRATPSRSRCDPHPRRPSRRPPPAERKKEPFSLPGRASCPARSPDNDRSPTSA